MSLYLGDKECTLFATIENTAGNIPVLQNSKTVIPQQNQQTIKPDNGYDALKEVIVRGDSALSPENIMLGQTIFGVTGTGKTTPILQDLTITPSSTIQNFTPAQNIDGFSSVSVAAVETEDITITSNGTYNPGVNSYFSAITVDVQSELPTFTTQDKTITPTEEVQDITPDSGYDGLSKVTINPISTTYIGSEVQRMDGLTVTPSISNQTINTANKYLNGNITVAAIETSPLTNSIIGGVSNIKASGTSVDSFTVTLNLPEGYHEQQQITKTFTNILPALNSDASSSQIRNGYKTYNASGEVLIGAMTEYTDQNISLSDTKTSYDINEGYYYGINKVSVNTVAVPSPTISVDSTGKITASGSWTKGYTTNNSYSNTKTLSTQSAVTVTPTKTEQTIVTSGKYTLGDIKVAAIPANYIIPSGSQTINTNGSYNVSNLAEVVVNIASSGGSSLPTGIQAFDFGDVVISNAFTTSRQTFPHKLGVVPDLMIVYTPSNIATTYSMLAAIRGNVFGWRSSAYNNHMFYHGNSTTTVTWTNSNSTTFGISNMTATNFQLSSSSASYYWRVGNYKYIAIKFS